MKTRKLLKGREITNGYVVIVFSFASDLMARVFRTNHKNKLSKTKASPDYFRQANANSSYGVTDRTITLSNSRFQIS